MGFWDWFRKKPKPAPRLPAIGEPWVCRATWHSDRSPWETAEHTELHVIIAVEHLEIRVIIVDLPPGWVKYTYPEYPNDWRACKLDVFSMLYRPEGPPCPAPPSHPQPYRSNIRAGLKYLPRKQA